MGDIDLLTEYSAFVDEMVAKDKKRDCCGYGTTPETLRKLHRASGGMVSEAGELHQILHKAVYRGHDWTITDIIKEAGDVAFYLQYLCNVLGITLDELVGLNMSKLIQRYPNGYEQELDVDRVEE